MNPPKRLHPAATSSLHPAATSWLPRQAITGTPFSIETRGVHVREDGAGLNVGIGRPASIGRFNVYNDTTGAGGMYVETSAGGEPFYGYKTGNIAGVSHLVDGDTGNWILRNGGDRVTVKSNGFVGINRDSQISSSETFGIYTNTSGNAYGGMYAATNANGRPFYGYATGGDVQAYDCKR